jgi:hypothetical protein
MTDQVVISQDKPSIFLALPNLLTENVHLSRQILIWAADPRYKLHIHWVSECRHHDYARNLLVLKFLESPCEWLLFVDSDTLPHPDLLELTKLGHKIIAGAVFCFMKGQNMPSIWQYAPCEQCVNVKHFKEKGEVHDKSQYMTDDSSLLLRWNPLVERWEYFGICRCGGTGRDPWVYRVHPDSIGEPKILQCDAVGTAATLIHRSVFEKMKMPYFRFLYKESREIMLTEDMTFCWQAKQAGFEIWASTHHICPHFKTMDLSVINGLMIQAYERGKQEATAEALKLNAENFKSGLIVPNMIPILER